MLRTALIYHFPSIPNQFEPHFDWLVELKPELNLDSPTIITWRVFTRIDLLNQGEKCLGELIKPHRAYYLELNKTQFLSKNRGIVKPIIKGNLVSINQINQQLNLKINWLNTEQLLNINLENNLIICLK